MWFSYHIGLQFVDTDAVLPDGSRIDPGGPAFGEDWPGDASLEAAETFRARIAARAAALRAAMPGLREEQVPFEIIDRWIDDGLSRAAAVARHERMVSLAGDWRGYRVALELYDRATFGSVVLNQDPGAAEEKRLRPALESLVATVCGATGQVLLDEGRAATSDPIQGAAVLLARSDKLLAEARRRYARERLRERLGWPSVALLTLLAWLLAGWIGWHGVLAGMQVAGVDPAKPLTFQTLSAPPVKRQFLGLFPDFELAGRILETGQDVQVEVYRDQFLAAGPGARFTAFATGRPAMPYVLREYCESQLPLVRIGSLAVSWHGGLALAPLALWGWLLVRPLLRAPAAARPFLLRGMSTAALRLTQIGAVAIIALTVRLALI